MNFTHPNGVKTKRIASITNPAITHILSSFHFSIPKSTKPIPKRPAAYKNGSNII